MECAGHVMSHALYVGICECAASRRVHRKPGSPSSRIGPSVSQVISYIASDVIGVDGVNSVGEDKSTMFKTYRGPLVINARLYEMPIGTCRSGDFSAAPIRGKEHDTRDTI